jgi:hypothetical protein
METKKSFVTEPIRRSLVLAVILACMGLAACADVAGTGDGESTKSYGTTSYMTQSDARSDNESAESDWSPAYEWFY